MKYQNSAVQNVKPNLFYHETLNISKYTCSEITINELFKLIPHKWSVEPTTFIHLPVTIVSYEKITKLLNSQNNP